MKQIPKILERNFERHHSFVKIQKIFIYCKNDVHAKEKRVLQLTTSGGLSSYFFCY